MRGLRFNKPSTPEVGYSACQAGGHSRVWTAAGRLGGSCEGFSPTRREGPTSRRMPNGGRRKSTSGELTLMETREPAAVKAAEWGIVAMRERTFRHTLAIVMAVSVILVGCSDTPRARPRIAKEFVGTWANVDPRFHNWWEISRGKVVNYGIALDRGEVCRP
jgi:hypothetical protein